MMFGRGAMGNLGGPGGFDHGCMLLGGHFFIPIVIILVIVGIVYLIRRNKSKPIGNQYLEMLQMKLVQGEITEEEYLHKKEVLLKK